MSQSQSFAAGIAVLTGRKWKNRHADGPVSAKKPRAVKERQKRQLAASTNPADDTDQDEGDQAEEETTHIAQESNV